MPQAQEDNNESQTAHPVVRRPADQPQSLAARIEQDRVATAQKFGVPLWILTCPVAPHMRLSPKELGA